MVHRTKSNANICKAFLDNSSLNLEWLVLGFGAFLILNGFVRQFGFAIILDAVFQKYSINDGNEEYDNINF